MHGSHRVRDRGQAMVLVLGIVATIVVLTLAVAAAGRQLRDDQRAANAADAAALAGTTGGRPAAARLAADNGGSLVSFVRTGSIVTVTVRVGSMVATARATNGP